MATFCKNVQDWVEETIQKPVESWIKKTAQQCRSQKCNWWCLCCNKWFCWLETFLVSVIVWIAMTVGKWVTRVVCEVVSLILDIVAFVVNLVLSIPIIGGIVRTILNWLTEIVWRAVGLIDLALYGLGVRFEKRMHVGLLIPRVNGEPITTEAAMMPQIDKARDLYKRLCNVKIIYSGACVAPVDAPGDALTVSCNASGFFSDWWLAGAFNEFATASCKFTDGWRRVLGFGAEIVIIPVLNVTPDSDKSSTVGCSFTSTHNYVVVEPTSEASVTAHEIGHACWLPHVSNTNNLMYESTIAGEPTLTSGQAALVRWSKHCVYF